MSPGPPSFYENDVKKWKDKVSPRGNGDRSVDFLKKKPARPFNRSQFKFAKGLRSYTPSSQVKHERLSWNKSLFRQDTSPVAQPRTIVKFKTLQERYK